MEGLLHKAGLQPPLAAANGKDLQRLYGLYTDIERHEAWKDFMSRLRTMHDTTVQSLVHGTLDKFGNSHDDERRAVLVALERILSYVPAIRKQHEDLVRKLSELEEKAKFRGIHPKDGNGVYNSIHRRHQPF